MIGKIFSVNTDIVYRREESLNLFEGKKKLDKVVSGRVFKEQIKLLGFTIRTKYFYQICCPQVNMNDANSTSKCKITKCFCKSTPLVLRNSISFLVSH